jgi:hypothetical protein
MKMVRTIYVIPSVLREGELINFVLIIFFILVVASTRNYALTPFTCVVQSLIVTAVLRIERLNNEYLCPNTKPSQCSFCSGEMLTVGCHTHKWRGLICVVVGNNGISHKILAQDVWS